jgi:hypothetical protein
MELKKEEEEEEEDKINLKQITKEQAKQLLSKKYWNWDRIDQWVESLPQVQEYLKNKNNDNSNLNLKNEKES